MVLEIRACFAKGAWRGQHLFKTIPEGYGDAPAPLTLSTVKVCMQSKESLVLFLKIYKSQFFLISEEMMGDVKRFLMEHKRELVIMQFTPELLHR